MADRLSLVTVLEHAKIDRPAAERIATEIYDAIHDNVATKQDIARLEVAVKADITRLEVAVKADITRLEVAVKADITRLEAATKHDLLELEHRLTLRFASVMVVLTGIIIAAIRYLPMMH